MSLSVVLLAALYAALKLHLTFAQRGPEQVQRSQKGRAIVELIAKDVRAVVQIPPVPKPETSSGNAASTGATSGTTGGAASGSGGSTSGGTGTGATASQGSTSSASASTSGATTSTASTASTGSTSSSSSTQPSAYRDSYGVLGGTDWLLMYVAHERADLDDAATAAAGGSIARAANILRVSYAATIVTTRPDAHGRTQRMGLTRTVVAAIGAEQFDTSSDDSDLRATTDYLSDDLARVQFQYWDDSTATWLDSWGADTPIAPPRAIRVTISLMPPDEYAESQLGLGGGISTWQPTFSTVIPISTWDPDAGSTNSSSATGG